MDCNNNDAQALGQEKAEENFQIEDESSLHNYRTETPNIILDMELDPFEYSLYSHIKRIAGDKGRCFASNRLLAKKACMSIDKVKRLKKVLVEKKLIRATVRKNNDNSFQTTLIQIIDWWPRNFQYFATKKEKRAAKLKEFLIGADKAEGIGADKADIGAENTQEEEPLKEELINKKDMSEVKTSLGSDDPHFCANYLLKKLKERRPGRKEPNIKQWTKDFELMIQIDRIPKIKIIEAIDFVMRTGSPFNIQSPQSLRGKYENVADHIVLDRKNKEEKERAKRDPRVAKTIKIINHYLLGVSAGSLPNTLSFVINPDGSVYHTIEKRYYPRTYEKFIEALKLKNVPHSLLSRIKSGVN